MTKHLPTRLLTLLTALSLSLLFTACGASSKGQSSETAMDAEVEEVIYENTAAEAPADKANSMLSDPLAQTSMPDGLNLKLIWRANLSMETLEFDKTLQQVSALVSELGGFIESSSSSAVRMPAATTSISMLPSPHASLPRTSTASSAASTIAAPSPTSGFPVKTSRWNTPTPKRASRRCKPNMTVCSS